MRQKPKEKKLFRKEGISDIELKIGLTVVGFEKKQVNMSDQDAEMNSQPAETTMIDTTGKKEKPLVPVNEFLKRRKKKDSPAKEDDIASDEDKPAKAAAAQDEDEDEDMVEGEAEAEVEDAPFGEKKPSSSRK